MPLTPEPVCDVCGRGSKEGPRGHWVGTAENQAAHEACLIQLLRWVVGRRALGRLPKDIMKPTDFVGRQRG